MSLSIRELSGRSWHEWPHTQLVEEMDALSPSPATSSSSTSATPTSSRSHSPKPLHESDACMRLPRKDMHIFGQCPVQDDFMLVICDICHASVKVEAFAAHVRLRHQKSKFNTKSCSVDLLKEDIFSLSTKPSTVTAVSAVQAQVPVVLEVTAPPVTLEPEAMEVSDPEPKPPAMDISDSPMIKDELFEDPPAPSTSTATPKPTENNVISIPDTDPLPHGMSNDLMAMVGEAPMLEQQAPSVIRMQVKSETGCSEKKISPLKISPVTPTRIDRKAQREYNADKHCGVWDSDTKRHCTRALTCKSHSVVLKRKIDGRSRPFDELVAAHKKAQAEAAAKATPATPQQGPTVTSTPIQVRPFTPTVSVTAPPSVASIRTITPIQASGNAGQQIVTATPVLAHVNTNQSISVAAAAKEEESLYYTTDHPRPLAVCGFRGGRRVGGLIVTGRNHVLTRKLVRVAITAGSSYAGGGFHRIRPRVFIGNSGTAVTTIEQHSSSSPVQPSSPYVLNYNLSGNIKRAGGSSGTGGVNLTTLPPGGVVIPESFKTDIQDFKGGIKFELGRKIKHILPSGSEVSK